HRAGRAFRIEDGLSGHLVYAAYRDREGNRWFATGSGLDRFRDNKVTPFSAQEGLVPDTSIAVASAGSRGAWIFSYTSDTVRLFDRGVFSQIVVKRYAPDDTSRILSIFADRTGHAYVGGSFKLAQESNGQFTFIHASEIEAGANVE